MKKILLLLLLLPLAAWSREKIGDFYYELEGNTATLVRGVGTYSGSIVIPSSVTFNNKKYTVTAVGGSAFLGSTSISSITIPNTVKTLGAGAFSTTAITTITIPNSVTSIGQGCFTSCSVLETVTFESNLSNITLIDKQAFALCKNLKGVYIKDLKTWCGIEFGDEYANPLYYAQHLFLNKSEIQNLIIPNAVEKVNSYAFYNCSGFKFVTVSNSVKSIGEDAFRDCSGMTSLTLGTSLTTIDKRAFENCRALTSLSIPRSVTTIGLDAFYGCSALASVTFDNGVMSIGDGAFNQCNLSSVYISDLTSWCKMSFSTLSSNPLYFAHRLYLNKKEIKDLVIPEGVESINKYVFAGGSFTSVTLPVSLNTSKEYAFHECNSLKALYISDLVKWCGVSFEEPVSNPLYYAHRLYLNKKEVTKLEIPDGVYSIGKYAFIGCTSFTEVVRNDAVLLMGDASFKGCTSLKSFIFPESLKIIPASCLEGCTSLTSLYLQGNIKNVNKSAFAECTSLKEVHCYAPSVPTADEKAFTSAPISKAVLYVPKTSIDSYKRTKVWKDFGRTEAVTLITVTAHDYTMEYGDAVPKLTYSVAGGSLTGTPSISCEVSKTSSVGEYTIDLSKGTVTSLGVTFVDGTLTVTKAPLTIKARNYTIRQGDDLPKFEVDYSGFKNNETEVVLLKEPVVTTTATKNSSVGKYAITVSGAEALNYSFVYVDGLLTITENKPNYIAEEQSNDQVFDVYNMFGVKICSQVKALNGLSAGLYIINGHQVLIK